MVTLFEARTKREAREIMERERERYERLGYELKLERTERKAWRGARPTVLWLIRSERMHP